MIETIKRHLAEYEEAAKTLYLQYQMNLAAAEALKRLLEETDGAEGETPPADESEVVPDEG